MSDFEFPQKFDFALWVATNNSAQIEPHGDIDGMIAGFTKGCKFVLSGYKAIDSALVLDYGPAELIELVWAIKKEL